MQGRNQAGHLIWETARNAVVPVLEGTIALDRLPVRTALALAYPEGTATARVELRLFAEDGDLLGQKVLELAPGRQVSGYVDELFPDHDRNGSTFLQLHFLSDQPIAALGLRENRNQHGEPMISVLPVGLPDSSAPFLARVAAGAAEGGIQMATRLFLLNPSPDVLKGTIRLQSETGQPLPLLQEGALTSEIAYEIAPNGVFATDLTQPFLLAAGYAELLPEAGDLVPSSLALIQYRKGEGVLSETLLEGLESSTEWVLLASSGRSTPALALLSEEPEGSIDVRLLDKSGAEVGAVQVELETGYRSLLLDQLIPDSDTLEGSLLRLSSSTPFVPALIRLTTNRRSETILASVPPVDSMSTENAAVRVIPHLFEIGQAGVSLNSEMSFFHRSGTSAANAEIEFRKGDGDAWEFPGWNGRAEKVQVEIDAGGVDRLRSAPVRRPELHSVEPGSILMTAGREVLLRGRNFSRKSEVIIRDQMIGAVEVVDSETIRLLTPDLDVGKTTLTVKTAQGLDQAPLTVGGIPLEELESDQVTTVLGGGHYMGDGGSSHEAELTFPPQVDGLTFSSDGRYLFFADGARIRRIHLSTREIHTVAGTGDPGVRNGPALTARLLHPRELVGDEKTLYFSEIGINANRIRKVELESGQVTTLIGSVNPRHRGFRGDGGPASEVWINGPRHLNVLEDGDLLFLDRGNCRVRKVDARSGIVETIAGNDCALGDGIPTSADSPLSASAMAYREGRLYLMQSVPAEEELQKSVVILLLNLETGLIETVAGGGTRLPTADAEIPADEVYLQGHLYRMVVDESGETIYLHQDPSGGGAARLLRFDLEAKTISPVRELEAVSTLALQGSHLYFAESTEEATFLKRFDLESGESTVIAGSESAAPPREAPAATLDLAYPQFVRSDETGKIYATDSRHRIRQVDREGLSRVVYETECGLLDFLSLTSDRLIVSEACPFEVGVPKTGFLLSVDLETGETEQLLRSGPSKPFPSHLAEGTDGKIIFSSISNRSIYEQDPVSGELERLAGTGDEDCSGVEGPAEVTPLCYPTWLAVGDDGSVYFSDGGSGARIRVFDRSSRTIRNLAGNGEPSSSDAEGTALQLPIRAEGLAADSDYLYYSDWLIHRIRRIDLETGIVSNYAGSGSCTGRFDGADRLEAPICKPMGVELAGDLLLTADQAAAVIRAVRMSP